jgi:predicted transcriptional regulator
MELENSREMSNKEMELEEKVSELKSDLKFALEEKKSIEKKLRHAKEKDGCFNYDQALQVFSMIRQIPEEQQQKLEALEQCLTKMEDRIEKLEEENENLQTNELNISRR